MKFKRAFLMEPHRFEIHEVEEEPGPGEVMMKVASCGLCNWELNFWDGNLNFMGYPHKLGHEFAGTVVKLGPGCTKFKVGDKISAVARGFGGFAEYRATPEACCEKLADNIDPKYALGEPQKCILTVLRATAPQAADYGVVLGCGPMGMWCIPDEENAVFMIGPWATAERSEKSRSWARRHIGEKGDDAVQSYYNGVRILSGSGFQASIVAVVSMMFPKEKFHLDQQKEFLPFHFTTDLRYFTEPEFQREIPIQMLEQRYANENAIWDAAACGNTEAALKACQQMARFTYGGRFFGSLYQTKIMLTVMNTLLRKAIERSNIHPYYIDEISSRYALMIENMVDEESWPLVQTMVKEYCAYVRRYSLQQYSPLVQKVINTINLNLSDQLSPKSLAAMYYISPSYLSSLFKQDTGTTLTDFINTQRIQRAANLLSTTEQNISVVAEQVGILDVNYFTKMFKKSMGSTPTQYRRQSRAR